MPFEKNDNRINRNGRPSGSPNKVTADIKELITEFISGNFEQMQTDFESLNSRERVKFYIDLLPYALPKLKAIETTEAHTDTLQIIVDADTKKVIDKLKADAD